MDQEKLPVEEKQPEEKDERESMVDLTPAETSYYKYWKRVEKDRFE